MLVGMVTQNTDQYVCRSELDSLIPEELNHFQMWLHHIHDVLRFSSHSL